MKKLFFSLLFVLTMCAFCFAQTKLPEFDKAKQIKLLQSTREDVKKIFAGYEYDDEDYDSHEQYFSTKNAGIEVSFSAGSCSDEDSQKYWNVPEWTVTKIEITPEDTIKLEDFQFDFSSFTKEIRDEEFPESFSYHNENAGIIFRFDEGEILDIILYPPQSKIVFLCANETTSEIISGEKRIIDFILEADVIVCSMGPNVTDLILSAEEIIISCQNDAGKKVCVAGNQKISVATVAVDPEDIVLLYLYSITGGKIIGSGANVIWDLSGVPPGTYVITAGVDGGGGVFGTTQTKMVVVRECFECSQIQKTEPSKP